MHIMIHARSTRAGLTWTIGRARNVHPPRHD